MRIAVALLVAVFLLLITQAPSAVALEPQKKCAYCGERIEGEWIVDGGKPYHRSCWRDHVVPRCAVCGEPLAGAYMTYDGKTYHRACWEDRVAARCSMCGGVLDGPYLKDAWGNRYHASHKSEAVECAYCGRLISEKVTGGGVRYADGRNVCSICRRTAVDDAGEGEKLLAEAASRLLSVGMTVDPSRVRLELVDVERMGEVSGDRSRPRMGYTRYARETTADGAHGIESVSVFVLTGMPKIETMGALAHELVHVWLSREGRASTAPPLAEGSCNFAAVKVVETYPGPESAYLVRKLKSSDDVVYGEGLRRVSHYVDRNGVPAWLELIRTRDDFPAGF